MLFKCTNELSTEKEEWNGVISKLIKHNGYYEIMVKSRSSIMIIFGQSSRGNFACMPDFGVGCHLVSPKDKFWNTEKLTEVLGKVDGITVASALYALVNKIRPEIT